jgi:hypothetical protein
MSRPNGCAAACFWDDLLPKIGRHFVNHLGLLIRRDCVIKRQADQSRADRVGHRKLAGRTPQLAAHWRRVLRHVMKDRTDSPRIQISQQAVPRGGRRDPGKIELDRRRSDSWFHESCSSRSRRSIPAPVGRNLGPPNFTAPARSCRSASPSCESSFLPGDDGRRRHARAEMSGRLEVSNRRDERAPRSLWRRPAALLGRR